ncbi:T9SS type A sorting domain-containing protein [Polaribacter sp. Hel1_85]|uniref:T9SS type A sorting domain-containing protein n=1 Tax=Polaribacter sp. Hel1_85 TaxID=1250005 RepID=UPI00052BAB64|nr:T9SS type A sorting domain-containing protein [Polaribacter sp. Hel1_85]KGL61907.1 hypothetical protein PHEL85_1693 [Polaribacter sp. Hel1_85]
MKKFTNIKKQILNFSFFIIILGLNYNDINAQTTIEVGELYSFVQQPSSTVNYQLTIVSPGEITIHIDNWKSTYNWDIDYDRVYVYNSNGVPLKGNSFASESDPFLFHMIEASEGLIFNVGKADTYTISVHSGEKWGWETATMQEYEMKVTAIYCDDVYEPNDNLASASTISVGSAINAFQWRQINTEEIQGDEDWYKVSINSPGILRIELVDWTALYNWSSDYDRLFVYNSAGESIGFAGGNDFYSWMMGGGTDTDPVVIEMNLSHEGDYYLRFHAGSTTNTTPYHFSTSFTPANDIYEPNDNFATAKLISEADVWYQAYEWRSVDNSMNVADDEDYYFFNAASAGEYSLTLDGWIQILNWGTNYDRLFIYDEFENPVGASPYAALIGSTPININIPTAGKYFLRLHCGNGYSTEGYKFKLSGSLTLGIEGSYENNHLLKLYPNPVSDIITLDVEQGNSMESEVTIYNINGQLIRSKTLNQNQTQINVADLAKGIYTLVLVSGERLGVKKFIIMK